jgi:LmbE family N-acetylglucosaminyl deacetylase
LIERKAPVWRIEQLQLTSFNDIERKHRHIFLSPHFDDVVYSCGGTLGVQVSCGLRPLVITVFAGIPSINGPLSPLATRIHQSMGLATLGVRGVIETRRKEDASALDFLQVDYLWLDYADAIYRGNPPHYTQSSQVIGGNVHPGDSDIDQQLAQELISLHERLPDAVWYAPLGIGRHVDHQIVASAVDRLVQRNAKVNFYEDFPYVLRQGALEARLNEIGTPLEPALVEMSEMLALRVEAASMYASQTAPNFGSEEALPEKIKQYTHSIRPVETVHLERYWTNR